MTRRSCSPTLRTKNGTVLRSKHAKMKTLTTSPLKKIENFISKVTRKVNEFCLDCDHNFSASKTVNGSQVYQRITACYDDFDAATLRTQVEATWLNATSGDVEVNHRTIRHHMAYQVICNLLTDSAMTDVLLDEKYFQVGNYQNSVLFIKGNANKVKPSTILLVTALKKKLHSLNLKILVTTSKTLTRLPRICCERLRTKEKTMRSFKLTFFVYISQPRIRGSRTTCSTKRASTPMGPQCLEMRSSSLPKLKVSISLGPSCGAKTILAMLKL